MIVAGVGCRRGAPAPDIETAIRAALTRAGIAADALDAIATPQAKRSEAGIMTAAEKLPLPTLKNMNPGESLGRFLMPQSLVPELPKVAASLDGQWINAGRQRPGHCG